MNNYNDNEQSRQYTLWLTSKGLSNRVREAERELAQRRQKRKHEAERKIRREQARTHPVEVELTKKQSKELLYVAFKPTKNELVAKR